MLDLGKTFSYEQLVIDNEIAGMVNRVLRGITVNDATLAAEVIMAVKPGGTFLGEQHTIDFMRTESSQVDIFDRTMRSTWINAGETDVKDRAQKKAQDILTNYKPVPLEKDVHDKIKSIIAEAEKELL